MMATFARCKGSIILVTRFLALPLLVPFGEDPFYSRKMGLAGLPGKGEVWW
jgi:hypothetical protein